MASWSVVNCRLAYDYWNNGQLTGSGGLGNNPLIEYRQLKGFLQRVAEGTKSEIETLIGGTVSEFGAGGTDGLNRPFGSIPSAESPTVAEDFRIPEQYNLPDLPSSGGGAGNLIWIRDDQTFTSDYIGRNGIIRVEQSIRLYSDVEQYAYSGPSAGVWEFSGFGLAGGGVYTPNP